MKHAFTFSMKLILLVGISFAIGTKAQSTAFKYQGSLTDGGTPANGSFQMRFKLFDAVSGGSQIGSTLADVPVSVSNGFFSLSLDFGSNALSGANRWIEIAIRHNAGESYVILSPREQIASSPYSVRTLSAVSADMALDSQKLGGVNANQFVQTNDNRLSDARDPLPGSGNYVQNQNAGPQASSNLNISGSATAGSVNVNGPLSVGAVGAPAVAPIGQSRFYFDAGANKLKVSESGAAYVNLVGATGVGGSGVANKIPMWSAGTTLGDSVVSQFGSLIGIGTTNPGAGLEVRGTGFSAGQRLTDNTSGNSLVLQSGAGTNMKVTGWNYNTSTAIPLYLSVDGANTLLNSGGGVVGVGTTNPDPNFRVDSLGSVRAFSPTSANFVAQTTGGTNTWARFYMRSPSQSWFMGTSQNFNGNQFYLNDETANVTRMVINTNGAFGFGTTNPSANFRADFLGAVRSFSDTSSHFVAETTGGTNTWARFYMRSPSQSWFMGTSQNFSGNQLYIVDETFNQTRMSIQPNGGPVTVYGNVDVNGYLKIKSVSSLAEISPGDCNQPSHYGRMVALNPGAAQVFLFVCFQGGWTAIYP